MAIEYFHLAGAHQQGIAFVQHDLPPARARRRFARLIDDKNEIAVAIGKIFARSRNSSRRHCRRNDPHTGQLAHQKRIVQLPAVDRLDVELHYQPAVMVSPHRQTVLRGKVDGGEPDSRKSFFLIHLVIAPSTSRRPVSDSALRRLPNKESFRAI